ncbi:MAG: hypothetical protein JNL61_01195 [Rhizobiaceae bacterium]|nr:hypothetical protein [Rhizobiaceae bacterium]
MTTRKPLAALAEFFGIVGSAVAASAAVRVHARPKASDLRRLGVDPAAFERIRGI